MYSKGISLVCGLVLASVAAAVTVVLADSVPFVPPAGWSSVRPPSGILGVWVHPGDTDFRQNIVVGRERTSLSVSDFDDRTIKQLRAALNGFQLGADQFTTTCGGRPAHYISYGSFLNGHQIIYEHMTMLANGYAWFAIYARLSSQPSLTEARQALTTLCGLDVRQTVRQQAAPAPAATAPNANPTPNPTPTPTPAPYYPTQTQYYTPTPIPT